MKNYNCTKEVRRAFGRDLRKARRRADLTQADLAKMTGVSGQTLSTYERGKSSASIDFIFRACLAMSLSVDEFLEMTLHKLAERQALKNRKG